MLVDANLSVQVGDRIEFSLSFSQKAKKNCAIDLKILRYSTVNCKENYVKWYACCSHGYLSPRKTERLRLKENDDSNARYTVECIFKHEELLYCH